MAEPQEAAPLQWQRSVTLTQQAQHLLERFALTEDQAEVYAALFAVFDGVPEDLDLFPILMRFFAAALMGYAVNTWPGCPGPIHDHVWRTTDLLGQLALALGHLSAYHASGLEDGR